MPLLGPGGQPLRPEPPPGQPDPAPAGQWGMGFLQVGPELLVVSRFDASTDDIRYFPDGSIAVRFRQMDAERGHLCTDDLEVFFELARSEHAAVQRTRAEVVAEAEAVVAEAVVAP